MEHGIKYYFWDILTVRGRLMIYGGFGALTALLIVIGLVAGQITSCNSNKRQKKIDEAANSEAEGKGAANVIEDNINEARNNARNAETRSNEAAENFNRIVNIPSTEFNSNFSTVRKRFCASHPADPACR